MPTEDLVDLIDQLYPADADEQPYLEDAELLAQNRILPIDEVEEPVDQEIKEAVEPEDIANWADQDLDETAAELEEVAQALGQIEALEQESSTARR